MKKINKNKTTKNFYSRKFLTISLSPIQFIIITTILIIAIGTYSYLITVGTLLFVSFILASLIRQTTKLIFKLTKGKVNKKIILIAVFISYLIIFWGGLILLFNQLINQSLNLLAQTLTTENIQTFIISPLKRYLPTVVNSNLNITLSPVLGSLLSTTLPINGAKNLLSTFPYIIFIFLASWYIASDFEIFITQLKLLLKSNYEKKLITKLIREVDQKVGNWAKAQLFLMFIIGVVTFIGLTIMKMPYALVLATIAGLLEIIPNLGPTLSAIPAIFIALITGGISKAILIIFLYFIIQQLENNLIVPHLMGSVANTHPLITILLIMTGQFLFGPTGAVLSIPFYITISAVIKTYQQFDKIKYGHAKRINK